MDHKTNLSKDPYAEPRPAQISQEEWSLRVQLAQCYHLVDYFGWTETIFNHISVRVPGSDTYLVNPFGLNYFEVTPSSLLKVDLDGKKVSSSEYDPNPAGFALHSAIHGARHDINCVIHTHTTPVSAIALKRNGLGHDDFYGAQFYGRVAYHAFEGITLYADEKKRLLASMGQKHVLILRNHGVAVGESDIPRAMFLLWTFQRACEIQCAAAALPGPTESLSPEVQQKTSDSVRMFDEKQPLASLWFTAQVREMLHKRR